MAKDSTVTNVDNGDDVDAYWGDQVKASIEALFDDKTMETQAYASSLTFNLNNGALQFCSLTGDPTIAISNQKLGRPFALILYASGADRTPSWFSTIKWAYNSPPDPVLSGKYNVYMFIPVAYSDPDWTYLGFQVGLEH